MQDYEQNEMDTHIESDSDSIKVLKTAGFAAVAGVSGALTLFGLQTAQSAIGGKKTKSQNAERPPKAKDEHWEDFC